MSVPEEANQIQIPASAMNELAMVESLDWKELEVTLTQLIDWINEVVEMYRPKNQDSRSSPNFTARSFRHYQTLGCIDSPRRVGKQAVYEFRHYLQALLIRKLLWEKVPSEQIVNLLKGKSNEEYKTLLFQGISIITGPETAETVTKSQKWTHTVVATGVELHISEDCSKSLDEAAIKDILMGVERTLRSHNR